MQWRRCSRLNGRESKIVKVEVHQGLVLGPLLFNIVLEALTKEFEQGRSALCRWSCFDAETGELLIEMLRKLQKGMKFMKCLKSEFWY